MSDNAAAFTGDIPRNYNAGLGPVLFAGYAEDLARRVGGGAPRRVLETAAGTGIMTRALRDVLPEAAHLVATDLNPAMLEIARTKFRPDERVEFQPADALSLPFPDQSFDAMACQFGVMFFPDKMQGYREAHRVLAPGGRYMFNVWDDRRHNPLSLVMRDVIDGFFAADPPPFFDVPFGYYAIDPVKEALLDVGFGEITVSVVRQYRPVPDPSLFARGFVFGSPVFDQIRQRGVDPERVAEALAEAFRRELGGRGETPMQAIVFEARKA
jgi:SAM-dependent methyltransferase